jgi:DNA-binding NtrC family response regulator
MQQFYNNQPVVVLVEDEVLVRACVAGDLEDAGFGVIEAADAEEALREFMDDDRVTILFSDINMRGSFDGLSLAHQIFVLRPAIRLILTSGRGSPAANEMPVGVKFLPKLYDFKSLAELIRAA